VAELEALMSITQMRVHKGDATMSTSERTAKLWVDVHRKRVAAWVEAASR
jgi:hypothetical protein